MDFNFASGDVAVQQILIKSFFGSKCVPQSLQILDSPRENEKVEVLLESHEGADRVILRYSTWVEGLGWCGQKTIHVDGEHLDDLHRALTVARHRINRKRAEAGQPREQAQVIQLPPLA